jgi:amino acid transporter
VINLKGVKNIGKIEVGVGIALIFSLIAVAVLLGLNLPANSLNLSKLNSSRFNFNWIYAIPMVYLVFVGNEDIAAIVEEVIDKEKNVPKVLLSSVVAITLLTATLSFLFINAFSLNQVIGNDQTFALLAQLNGQCGYMIGVTIAIFACVSSLFYGSLADTRTAFALSEAGELPKFFSKVNDNQVPAGSIIANISIVLILTLTRSAPLIAYIANIGLFLESIFVSLALLKLRKTRPHLPRNFLVKPFPLIPIIVILLNILLLMTVEVQAWSITIATSVIGLSFYLLSQSNQERKMWGAIGISLGVVITLAATYFLINNSQIMTQLLMMFIT